MKSIILEGPDGIGKSSFAQLIHPDVGHLHRDDVVGAADVTSLIRFFCARVGTHRVWDRFHLGSVVYGHRCHLHTTPIRGTLDELAVMRCLQSLAHVVVIWSSDSAWYRDHVSQLAEQRQELFDVDQMVRVNAAYGTLPRKTFDLMVDIKAGDWSKLPSIPRLKEQAKWKS